MARKEADGTKYSKKTKYMKNRDKNCYSAKFIRMREQCFENQKENIKKNKKDQIIKFLLIYFFIFLSLMTTSVTIKSDLSTQGATLNGIDLLAKLQFLQGQIDEVSALQTDTQCLSQTTENTVSMINPYLFNSVTYNSGVPIGMNVGSYTLTGITDAHPLGFVISDTNLFEVTSGTPHLTPKTVDGIPVQHYTGTIVVEVRGDFGTISYNCYNHGYMGGQNHLVFSPTCSTKAIG